MSGMPSREDVARSFAAMRRNYRQKAIRQQFGESMVACA